ncbi:hypothetical protein BE08_38435 [Sorangium cellulosum]|uniref:Uncharacterized protein n=1 Tax=Sorangium cellulosum TaxID=56 RepID=A0A150NYL5_SORCE|nr:hypothetical protein BE08_38435 [Sorangium cellulosum]
MRSRSHAHVQGEPHGASLTLIWRPSRSPHRCPCAGPHEHAQVAGGAERPRLPTNGCSAANAAGQPGSIAGAPSYSAK